MKISVSAVNVTMLNNGEVVDQQDLLATEEPLEIGVVYSDLDGKAAKSISVTMRTPGNDPELALGFLYTEGIIKGMEDVLSVRHLSGNQNIISIALSDNCTFAISKLQRHFYMSSSCGVCGKTSIASVRTKIPQHTLLNDFKVDAKTLMKLPETLRMKQIVFKHTGGLHASALFTQSGSLITLREDVGRHNALDKICGSALQSGLMPLNEYILLLSGRASFELIQKAAMCGIRIVAAIGAPSGLAVEMAEATGITLLGFLRNSRLNIYTNKHRIIT